MEINLKCKTDFRSVETFRKAKQRIESVMNKATGFTFFHFGRWLRRKRAKAGESCHLIMTKSLFVYFELKSIFERVSKSVSKRHVLAEHWHAETVTDSPLVEHFVRPKLLFRGLLHFHAFIQTMHL